MIKKIMDIMLDLESLAKDKKPALTQVSAVAFDIMTKEKFKSFNQFVSPMSCVKYGLSIDGDTVSWWLSQDKKVIQKVLVKAINSGLDLKQVLLNFSKFINDIKEEHNVDEIRLWGNGCLSDNNWLESAYDAVGLPYPWRYNEHCDVRTLVDIGRRKYNIDPKETIEFLGDKHDAIDDCHFQIDYCHEIYTHKGE